MKEIIHIRIKVNPFNEQGISSLPKELSIFHSLRYLTLSRRRSLSHRNQPIDMRASQWTGFYMIGTTVMKQLKMMQSYNDSVSNVGLLRRVGAHKMNVFFSACEFRLFLYVNFHDT